MTEKMMQRKGAVCLSASAGTGKTWMVAHMALSWVLRGVPIERLLVTTFTNAATDEMAGRIRDRLQDVLDFVQIIKVESVEIADAEVRCGDCTLPIQDWHVLDEVISKAGDVGVDRVRILLERALSNFDLAQITTIHGFCHWVVSKQGYELAEEGRELGEVPASLWESIRMDALAMWDYEDRTGCADEIIRLAMNSPRSTVEPAPETVSAWQVHLRDLHQQWCAVWDEGGLKSTLSGAGFDGRTIGPLARKLNALAMIEDIALADKWQLGGGKGVDAYADYFPNEHALVREIEAYRGLVKNSDKIVAAEKLARDTLEQREGRLSELSVLPFDDLLYALSDALQGAQGYALAEQLRADFDVVIVDEFQDTDPVQAQIFDQLFLGRWKDVCTEEQPHCFVLVGDPKQSIYRFRDADIKSYQRLADKCSSTELLDTNHRSDKLLVDTLNRMYQRMGSPFGDAISYAPVKAANKEVRLSSVLCGDAPLQVWCVAKSASDDKVSNKGVAQSIVTRRMARHIASRIGKEWIRCDTGWRLLRASDIAVLGLTNSQLDRMRSELRQIGVNAAQRSHKSVWHENAAQAWLHLLRAMDALERGDVFAMRRVSLSLCSPFFGMSPAQVVALREGADTDAYADGMVHWVEKFSSYAETLHTQGPLVLLQQLMDECLITQASENVFEAQVFLTHSRHLAELLHEAWVNKHQCHISELLSFAKEAYQDSALHVPDAHKVRIEAESEAVQLVTLHASKGLEYGVVYLPDLWSHQAKSKKVPFVVREGGREVLDLGSSEQGGRIARECQKDEEETARLLYVALTRSRHQIVVAHADYKEGIALAKWLALEEGQDDIEGVAVSPCLLEGACEPPAFAEGFDQCPEVSAPNATQADEPSQLKAPQPLCVSPQWLREVSFSGLMRAPQIGGAAEQSQVNEENSREDALLSGVSLGGIGLGHVVHESIEHLLLRSVGQRVDAIDDIVRERLALHYGDAYEIDQANILCADMRRLADLPLPLQDNQGPSLCELQQGSFASEFSFMLPLHEAGFNAKEMAEALRAGVSADDDNWHSWCDSVARFDWQTVRGFMKGNIDLVLHHANRWHIVDWKTNRGVGDCHPASLWQAMTSHNYPLQAALYTLGLHRLLKVRLADYDPELHLGSAHYLFLRGMNAEVGDSGGVWARRFNLAQLEALESLCHDSEVSDG